ncbi:MAG: superoxide dismutase [Bacilli bacterium]|nr:superoxide dismutase [Bacilli bacterium]
MYILNKLNYGYSTLEPFIDTHTLGLHHMKHQKNYLDKLNQLLIKNNYDFRYSLIELTKHINEFPKNDQSDILYNLGGVINHNIYFNSMSPTHEKPNAILMKKIIQDFGSFNNLLKQFKEKALSIKGSGYTFLVLNENKLELINLSNQDNPYSLNLTPLIAIDMWEHAYYINYQNKKDIYINNFLEILDFNNANKYFR